MDIFINLLTGLGILTLCSAIFLGVLLILIPPRNMPDDYDEVQDDFHRSMERWAAVQERKSK